MTDLTARAEQWLERQKATVADDLLDEGDCRTCGWTDGKHEPTDSCGIVADLLQAFTEQAQQIATLTAAMEEHRAVELAAIARAREAEAALSRMNEAYVIAASRATDNDVRIEQLTAGVQQIEQQIRITVAMRMVTADRISNDQATDFADRLNALTESIVLSSASDPKEPV